MRDHRSLNEDARLSSARQSSGPGWGLLGLSVAQLPFVLVWLAESMAVEASLPEASTDLPAASTDLPAARGATEPAPVTADGDADVVAAGIGVMEPAAMCMGTNRGSNNS